MSNIDHDRAYEIALDSELEVTTAVYRHPGPTWKPVVGYEGIYEVSNTGLVRRVGRTSPSCPPPPGGSKHIAPAVQHSGHLRVGLTKNYVRSSYLVHRLVLEAFVGPCPDGMECRHLNGDPQNNRVENLRWGSGSANTYDQIRHGRHVQARKTHCPQGHAYTPSNTETHNGRRSCRTCKNSKKRARRNALREASK